MVRSSWWLAASVVLGCASSPGSSHPAPDASMPVAAQTLDAPAERAQPDAGLTLKPMTPPATGTISDERLELDVPSPAAAAGIRATQNDAQPPTNPGLRLPKRPYSPVPPKPDSEGRIPVPRQDPNTPTAPVRPKAPANSNAPPANR